MKIKLILDDEDEKIASKSGSAKYRLNKNNKPKLKLLINEEYPLENNNQDEYCLREDETEYIFEDTQENTKENTQHSNDKSRLSNGKKNS